MMFKQVIAYVTKMVADLQPFFVISNVIKIEFDYFLR